MANVSVYNMEGKEVGTMELNDAVFGVEVNEHLVHMAVVAQFEEIKTKNFKNVMNNLNVSKALVVLAENDQNVVLSARNIPEVRTSLVNTLSVYDIPKYNTVVATKAAVASIEEVYA